MGVLVPLINGFVSLVIALFIIAGLLVIDPGIALAAGAGFAVIYVFVTIAIRKPLLRNGRVVEAVMRPSRHPNELGEALSS